MNHSNNNTSSSRHWLFTQLLVLLMLCIPSIYVQAKDRFVTTQTEYKQALKLVEPGDKIILKNTKVHITKVYCRYCSVLTIELVAGFYYLPIV